MVCSNCGKKHSGGLCPWCVHVAAALKPTEAQLESLARRSDTRHGVPTLLSFFVPGFGQLIKGNIGTALTVWLGLGIFIGVGLAGLWLTFLGIPILWIWSLYDAYVAPDEPTKRDMKRLANLAAILTFALGIVGCRGATPGQSESTCALCAPGGVLSCAGPGEDPCPGSGDAGLPICGVLPGYSVSAVDCGGRTINGLRCVTGCSWEIGPDASAEIDDAGSIAIAPGCMLPIQGKPGVCVVNCSDCQ